MTITINGQKYFLIWNYFFNSDTTKGERDITQLIVKLDTEIVAEKYICKNPKEKFEKSKARKYSLRKLLKDWELTKGERTEVWNQYFQIVKKK